MLRRTLSLALVTALAACSKPYGPENAWFHAETRDVPEELAGTGIAAGDTIHDFTFVDQNGQDVQLYQFYGQVVQLVLMAQWCPPCQEEAPAIEAASVDLAESGVVIVEVMLENNEGDYPTAEDCGEWADAYGATHPIVADPADTFVDMLNGGYPTLPVLDRDMTIVNPDNFPFDAALLSDLAGETAE